jgi:hypothetical protein
MSMQVLPTAPSPTVTHFMNLEALILHRPLLCPSFLLLAPPLSWFGSDGENKKRRDGSVCCGRGKKGRGDREAGANGGKSARRGREGCGGRRKRSPRRNGRWVGTTPVLAGCPCLSSPTKKRRTDGVGRDRDVPTVCARIISFSVTLALLSVSTPQFNSSTITIFDRLTTNLSMPDMVQNHHFP